jgi:two-component system, sensor histidine kinase and response regulator
MHSPMARDELRILLVDPNREDADRFRDLVSHDRETVCATTHVTNVSDALAHCEDGRFDVLLLEIDPLESVGTEAVEMFQEKLPALPIVVLTRLDCSTLAHEALWRGAQDVLCKSWIDSRLLARTLRYAVERQTHVAELLRATTRAQKASAVKSEWVAHISHDIRTPLTSILGMTELLLDTKIDAEQREHLLIVSRAGEGLLSLISDILDLSRIEANQLPIEKIPFSLNSTLRDIVQTLGPKARNKGLDVRCRVAPDVPDALLGDPARVRQVLLNLTSNAIKFTDAGTVGIDVLTLERSDSEVVLEFAVSDSGIGIPEEVQRSLFTPYTQVHQNMRKYGGTGLGLSISARVIECLGGRIWVESRVGTGSIFHFTVPYQIDSERVLQPRLAPAASLAGMKVLLVEDNRATTNALMEQLGELGIRAFAARASLAALDELQRARERGEPYSIVLVDTRRSSADRFELVEMMRAEQGNDCPAVIVMALAGEAGDANRCKQLGVAGYLTKPISNQDLLGAIRAVAGSADESKHDALVTRHSLREARRRLHVLVAEDDDANRRLVMHLLRKCGHSAFGVTCGESALQAIAGDEFDAVLMDVQMPGKDGFETTREIRAAEVASGVHLPIIALTAHSMRGDMERCLAAGMDDYVAKPIRAAELYDALARIEQKTER